MGNLLYDSDDGTLLLGKCTHTFHEITKHELKVIGKIENNKNDLVDRANDMLEVETIWI